MKNGFRPASPRLAAILALALLFGAFGVAWSANKDLAPADTYFGRLKLSYLGINATLRDQAAYANPHSTDSGIINKVSFAEDALQDWQSRYPKDSQLARSYFLASETFKRLWVQEYQDKAWYYMQLILKRYPNTFFSKTVTANLAGGYTEHFYAEAVACAEPGETAASPKPIATPGAQRGERGTRKYDIIAVPCFTPTPVPTPSPAPTSTPEPVPSATASQTPAAVSSPAPSATFTASATPAATSSAPAR